MTVFSSECFTALRRLARRSLPLAAVGLVALAALFAWTVVRHRGRVRRGEISERPGRTRIAPLP